MRIKQLPEDFVVEEVMDLTLEKQGTYAYYLLRKQDITLHEALQDLAEKLRIREKYINVAGIKDKHAITTQHISISRGPKKDLKNKHYSLKFLGHGDCRINLGMLEGNRFIITVRDIQERPEQPSQFLNTFGEQRFGMHRNNQEIGRLIVQGRLKEAADLLAVQHREVAAHLADHPKDAVGAIRRLRKDIALLYIHAYQSFLWNRVAKELAKREKEQCLVPLLGISTEFVDKDIETIYRSILQEEGIRLTDFIIRKIPELTTDGAERRLYIDVKDMKIGALKDDELNKGKKKVVLSFGLPKGSYATEVIAQCRWAGHRWT
ncbi:MAG: tRNA pseudouridine(13) synthase TruD [DPANN group archaeon]|nr:tRNA pseudouridine(13) synthase TruD [DPANN group archaeon]